MTNRSKFLLIILVILALGTLAFWAMDRYGDDITGESTPPATVTAEPDEPEVAETQPEETAEVSEPPVEEVDTTELPNDAQALIAAIEASMADRQRQAENYGAADEIASEPATSDDAPAADLPTLIETLRDLTRESGIDSAQAQSEINEAAISATHKATLNELVALAGNNPPLFRAALNEAQDILK